MFAIFSQFLKISLDVDRMQTDFIRFKESLYLLYCESP